MSGLPVTMCVYLIEFNYDNSGKQCFICVRYENGKGDKGPWGPMVLSFIP
jgi:hypothetical protein